MDPFHNHFICFEISQHPSDDLHKSMRQELQLLLYINLMLITERPSISVGTSMYYCNKNKAILPLITKRVFSLSVSKSDAASTAH